MRRINKSARLALIAFSIWTIDFLTKNWAVSHLSSAPRQIIGTFLQLRLLRNPGAAFSAATSFTLLFTALSFIVVAIIVLFAHRITSTAWSVVAALVLGGVLGNLSDRIFRAPSFLYGHVIDWIELPHWPIFNIADSSISIAAAIAVVLTARNVRPFDTVKSAHNG